MHTLCNRREFLSATALLAASASGWISVGTAVAKKTDILNFNSKMKYRRLGKTGLNLSELSLGGHWRNREGGRFWGSFPDDRVPDDVQGNRRDVIDHAIELGVNYVDITTPAEAVAYGHALKGRREKMFVGYSDYLLCIRDPKNRTNEAIMREIDEGLHHLDSDYIDIYRPQALTNGKHTDEEIRIVIEVAQQAMKQGKIRHLGISSHNRPFLMHLMQKFPEFEMVIFPFAGFSKVKQEDSIFSLAKKKNVGVVAIKPFSGGSLFSKNKVGDGKEVARLSLRRILSNKHLTCTVPGTTTTEEMDNNFRAAKEPRKLSREEADVLDNALVDHWASLPPPYQWLRQWTHV